MFGDDDFKRWGIRGSLVCFLILLFPFLVVPSLLEVTFGLGFEVEFDHEVNVIGTSGPDELATVTFIPNKLLLSNSSMLRRGCF